MRSKYKVVNKMKLPSKLYDNTWCECLISVSDCNPPQRFIVAEQLQTSSLFQSNLHYCRLILDQAPINTYYVLFSYFGFAFMVSPLFGLTIDSNLKIRPGTFEEKLKTMTGCPRVMGVLTSKTTICALNSLSWWIGYRTSQSTFPHLI